MPIFTNLTAARDWAQANLAAGMAAGYEIQRSIGAGTLQDDRPGIRLAAIRYRVVFRDAAGRELKENRA